MAHAARRCPPPAGSTRRGGCLTNSSTSRARSWAGANSCRRTTCSGHRESTTTFPWPVRTRIRNECNSANRPSGPTNSFLSRRRSRGAPVRRMFSHTRPTVGAKRRRGRRRVRHAKSPVKPSPPTLPVRVHRVADSPSGSRAKRLAVTDSPTTCFVTKSNSAVQLVRPEHISAASMAAMQRQASSVRRRAVLSRGHSAYFARVSNSPLPLSAAFDLASVSWNCQLP